MMTRYRVTSLIFLMLLLGGSVLAQSKARKFDEFTLGIGNSEASWGRGEEEKRKEFELRFARYAKQLRKEKARPFIIAYGPRVVAWETYNRSIADMRISQATTELTGHGYDYKSVNSVDGGFRDSAATELWIIPPGAQLPSPTPTVRSDDVAYCPFVRIDRVPYVYKPSGPIEFRALVETNYQKTPSTFEWKVSQGEIVKGQGTDTIAVKVPDGTSGDLIARVDLGGYSLQCPIKATSAIAKTTFGVDHFKLDEYGNICEEDEMARLDNLAIELQNHPEFQVYVIFYGGRCYSSCENDYPLHRMRRPRKGEAESRAGRIKPYLTETRRLDPERVFVIYGGHKESWMAELWIVPKGAKPPVPTPTVQPEDIKYGVGKPTKREFLQGCLGG